MRTITIAERALLGGLAERVAAYGSAGIAATSAFALGAATGIPLIVNGQQGTLPVNTSWAGGVWEPLGNNPLAAGQWAIAVLGYSALGPVALWAGVPGAPVPGGFATEAAAKRWLNYLAIQLAGGVYLGGTPAGSGPVGAQPPAPATNGAAPVCYLTVQASGGASWTPGTDAWAGWSGGTPAAATNLYNDPTLAGYWAVSGINHHLRVEIQNNDGSWIDVSAWVENGTSWGESANQACWDATVMLRRDGLAPTAQSLVPLVASSPWNVDNSGQYAPLLNPGSLIRFSTAIVPKGVTPTQDPGFARGATDTQVVNTVPGPFCDPSRWVSVPASGTIPANTPFGIGTGTIVGGHWAVWILVTDGTVYSSYFDGTSGTTHSGGFATEELARAAVAGLLAANGASYTVLAVMTVQASGAGWTAGTDALAGGSSGNPALATNFYFTPTYCGWKDVFQGVIDSVAWATSPIQVKCRDLSAWIADATIETPVQYANPGPVPIETVMAEVLGNTPVRGTPTLYTPVSPAWNIYNATGATQPNDKSVLDALQNDWAATIGWLCRYRYDPLDNFQLTFYNPGRTSVVPVLDTFGPTEYRDITDATLSYANTRNSWWGSYYDNNGVQGFCSSPPIADWITSPTPSQLQFGIRFAGVEEPAVSLIKDPVTLQALLDAARADTEFPFLSHTMATAYAWHVQLQDGVEFRANGDHYDQDQILAVVQYRHTVGDDGIVTTIGCNGYPVGSYANWLKRANASRAANSTPIDLTGVTISPGVTGSGQMVVNLPPTAQSALWLGSGSAFPSRDDVLGGGTVIAGPGPFTITTPLSFGETWYVSVIPFSGPSGTGIAGPLTQAIAGFPTYSNAKTISYSPQGWLQGLDHPPSAVFYFDPTDGSWRNPAEFSSDSDTFFQSLPIFPPGVTLDVVGVDVYSNTIASPEFEIYLWRVVAGTAAVLVGSGFLTPAPTAGWVVVQTALSELVVSGYTYLLQLNVVANDTPTGPVDGALRFSAAHIEYTPAFPDQTL